MRLLLLIAPLCLTLAVTGCGKKEKAGPVAVATIDATRLRPALSSASPETKAMADAAMVSLQQSDWPGALANLEKLAADPSLTPAQKKVVTEVADQLKQRLAAPPPGVSQ